MNLKAKWAVALVSVMLFFTGGAKAMTVDEFRRMNNDDDAGYVTFLIEASAQQLKSQGQPDQAAKIISYFHDPSRDGGVAHFASNLKLISNLNNRNATNPNNRAPVLQVEDAMAFTLKDIGITVPADFLLTTGKNFVPVGPPRSLSTGQ